MWSFLWGLFAGGARTASNVAVAPGAAEWVEAWVVEERERADVHVSHMGPELRPAWLSHVLEHTARP